MATQLILCVNSVSLLNLFLNCTTFCRICRISMCNICKQIILLLFQFRCLFISFCCPTSLARASIAELNRGGKNGHPYHLPDLREKTSNFLSLSIIFPVGFLYMAFIMSRQILPNFLSIFFIKECWFVKCLLYINWSDHVITLTFTRYCAEE